MKREFAANRLKAASRQAGAWINPAFADEKDRGVGKVGYEINFNRHFYTYQPPRPAAEIDINIRKVEKNILEMLKEVMG